MAIIFKRRAMLERQVHELKSAIASVTATPRMVETLRAYDGMLQSYGEVYRKLAPVRTVVDFLADAVSTTSLKVYRRTPSGRPEAYSHPLAVLLRHPNPGLSQRALIAGTVKDVAVYANAYWQIVDMPSRVHLVPLPPAQVVPRGGGLIGPEYYDVYPVSFDSKSVITGGKPYQVAASSMVHFRLYDPEDRRYGTSKLEALKNILSEEVEASKHRKGYWANAARPDMVLVRPLDAPPWSDEARTAFQTDWRNVFGGSNNAGRTAVAEEGMTPHTWSFNPKDSEFIAGREFVLQATARVYNVPVSLLGLTATSTYASQKEFHRQLYQDTLPPWYELIQSEIELQLMPLFESDVDPDVYVEFNVESKLRGSFEEQAGVLSTAIGRPWMTAHEGRDRTNLPDRGDPSDDELAIPTNNVSLGVPPPAPTPPPAAALPPASNGQPKAAQVLELKRTLDREQHALLEAAAAGVDFDFDRWHRKLSLITSAWSQEAQG